MTLREMMLTGLFAALLAISSQISLPLGPVPVTLQVFVVLLAGAVLGARLGLTSVLIWLLLGSFGLPVFAQGKAGIAVLAGPTGGFLAGFAVAAWLVGRLCEKNDAGYRRLAWIMFLAVSTIYIFGLCGFMASFLFFLHKPMTFSQAVSIAILPFLPVDVLKTGLAVYCGVKIRRALIRAGLIQKNI